jgi:hypothetical protein
MWKESVDGLEILETGVKAMKDEVGTIEEMELGRVRFVAIDSRGPFETALNWF